MTVNGNLQSAAEQPNVSRSLKSFEEKKFSVG
jgi:hypothetical protein